MLNFEVYIVFDFTIISQSIFRNTEIPIDNKRKLKIATVELCNEHNSTYVLR